MNLQNKINEYIKLRSKPLKLYKDIKLDEFGFDNNKLIPLGKCSFNLFKGGKNDEYMLLTKSRYRRMHDYDLWIDLNTGWVYVDDGKNPHFLDEWQGILKDLENKYGGSYNIAVGLPRDKFELIESRGIT